MKTNVIVLLLASTSVAWGVIVGQFTDWDRFVKLGQDIVIADCTRLPTNKVTVINGHQVIEDFGEFHQVEVQIVRTLKGTNEPGKQIIATIYDMVPGKRYLLYNGGGSVGPITFVAVSELSVVEMLPTFDLKSLENKSLTDQIFLIYRDRLTRVKVLLEELENEKWALRKAVPD